MSQQPLVLGVDDEASILRLMDAELTSQGFRVVTARSGEEALRVAERERPDVALLDIMLPGMSGLDVMERLRQRSPIPVILVSALNSSVDKVQGLEAGADDYIAKPFRPEELSERVRAVLRRAGNEGRPAGGIVRAGKVEIDLDRRIVRKECDVVRLTRTEWALLRYLALNPGKVLVNNQILAKVWGPEYRDEFQYLRVWVFRLRSKIEDEPSEPKVIRTVTGVGYTFQADEAGS